MLENRERMQDSSTPIGKAYAAIRTTAQAAIDGYRIDLATSMPSREDIDRATSNGDMLAVEKGFDAWLRDGAPIWASRLSDVAEQLRSLAIEYHLQVPMVHERCQLAYECLRTFDDVLNSALAALCHPPSITSWQDAVSYARALVKFCTAIMLVESVCEKPTDYQAFLVHCSEHLIGWTTSHAEEISLPYDVVPPEWKILHRESRPAAGIWVSAALAAIARVLGGPEDPKANELLMFTIGVDDRNPFAVGKQLHYGCTAILYGRDGKAFPPRPYLVDEIDHPGDQIAAICAATERLLALECCIHALASIYTVTDTVWSMYNRLMPAAQYYLRKIHDVEKHFRDPAMFSLVLSRFIWWRSNFDTDEERDLVAWFDSHPGAPFYEPHVHGLVQWLVT